MVRECEEVVVSELHMRVLSPGQGDFNENQQGDQPDQLQKKGAVLFEQGMPAFYCYSICAGKGELAKHTRQGKKTVFKLVNLPTCELEHCSFTFAPLMIFAPSGARYI